MGEESVPGGHDGIIDVATFDQAQVRLKQNAWTPGNPHRTKMESLLRGIIYCSCCGSGMYSTYSASKQRRYRYYVCYRAQQKLEGYCTTRAVSAPSVEDAVIEGIQRVGVNPEVLAETVRVARQRLSEALSGVQNELSATNLKVKNLKSQLARARNPDPGRVTELHEQVATGEACRAGLRKGIFSVGKT